MLAAQCGDCRVRFQWFWPKLLGLVLQPFWSCDILGLCRVCHKSLACMQRQNLFMHVVPLCLRSLPVCLPVVSSSICRVSVIAQVVTALVWTYKPYGGPRTRSCQAKGPSLPQGPSASTRNPKLATKSPQTRNAFKSSSPCCPEASVCSSPAAPSPRPVHGVRNSASSIVCACLPFRFQGSGLRL